MGKYMKKGKITGDVAVMEVGVRTRAKTLALQQNPELSYLQLRSRRLEKTQFQPPLPKHKAEKQTLLKQGGQGVNSNSNLQRTGSRFRVGSVNSGSVGSISYSCSENEGGCFGNFTSGLVAAGSREAEEVGDGDFGGPEASFGENNLEYDGAERSTRESTPCSLVREMDTIGTPGSAARPSCSSGVSRRGRNVGPRIIPTMFEMEEFFAIAELQQQKLFMEKYNFDVVNDLPLPGRYEWVRVDP